MSVEGWLGMLAPGWVDLAGMMVDEWGGSRRRGVSVEDQEVVIE